MQTYAFKSQVKCDTSLLAVRAPIAHDKRSGVRPHDLPRDLSTSRGRAERARCFLLLDGVSSKHVLWTQCDGVGRRVGRPEQRESRPLILRIVFGRENVPPVTVTLSGRLFLLLFFAVKQRQQHYSDTSD